MSSKKNIIRSAPLVFAFLFLFNPNFTVIDPLPDFLGYILLCMGIYRLSDIHEKIGDAYNAFKKMIFVDAGKWLAVLWVFGMSVPSERNSSLLLWTFVFSVLEIIFLISAYNKLFDGLIQVGYLYPCNAIFGKREKTSRTDKVRAFTIVFVISKAVLGFLPELTDLASSSYDETGSTIVNNLSDYKNFLRMIAFGFALIIGIAWIISIISYFRAIAKDRQFEEALSNKYISDILPKRGIFARRNLVTVISILAIAICLTVDFKVDSQNIFPDFLAAIMFTAALIFIQKIVDFKFKVWGITTIAYFLTSVASAVIEFKFFERYEYGDIIKSDEVKAFYVILTSVNVLKALCFFFLVFLICKALCKVVTEHTGYVVGRERIDESEKRLIAEAQKELKRGFIFTAVAAAVYAVSDICFDIFSPILALMPPRLVKINDNLFDIGPSETLMVVINLILATVFIIMFFRALFALRHAVDTKYMLE